MAIEDKKTRIKQERQLGSKVESSARKKIGCGKEEKRIKKGHD